MKVLITSDFYRPTVNGVVTSLLNLKKGLEALGHEVRILTLRQRDGEPEEGVWYLPSVGLDALVAPCVRLRVGFAIRICEEVIRWGPDVVHSQCEFCTFGIARKIAARRNVPLIQTYHTVYEDYAHYLVPFSDRAGRYAAKKFTQERLRHADAVIVPTDKTARLLNGYGLTEQIYTVPSGLDLTFFRAAQTGAMYEKIRSIAAGRRVLLFLGRLAPEKNVAELISYFRRINDPDFALVIVGDGPSRQALEESARDMAGRVYFLGMVSPKEVPACYAASDIFWSASTSETQGLTYIEALASGKPVLCRADECLQGVVLNSFNGWLYRDYDACVQGLYELTAGCGSGELAQQCRLSADRYSIENFAKSAEKIYLHCRTVKTARLCERKNLRA